MPGAGRCLWEADKAGGRRRVVQSTVFLSYTALIRALTWEAGTKTM